MCQGDGFLDNYFTAVYYSFEVIKMARTAREKSISGLYHVMLRGVGKQILFEDTEDYTRFLESLDHYKSEQVIGIHAYCLMENHVHLLIEDKGSSMDLFMKKLEGSYAFYFNHKYERVGTLFQDRYKSEPVNSDSYYITVFRYILQNPVKAGICAADGYQWNSYSELLNENGITSPEFCIGIFGDRAACLKYMLEPNEDACMEYAAGSIGDKTAAKMISDLLSVKSGTELQQYDREKRDAALHRLKENGLSVRQIERLTGISRGIVLKA